MRKLFSLSLLLSGMILLGCNGVSKEITKEINAKSIDERTDVFREIQVEETLQKGFVDLMIKADLKTHVVGFYLWEPLHSFHGQPKYPFLFNIDGQAATWNVDGSAENTPAYSEKGVKAPDGGQGMRYVLNKRIRLGQGTHRVFFALIGSEDECLKEFQITLKDDILNMLELKPIYRKDRHGRRSYLKGIRDYEVFLNGTRI